MLWLYKNELRCYVHPYLAVDNWIHDPAHALGYRPTQPCRYFRRGNELCLEVLSDPAFGSSLTDWAGLEEEPALLISETVRGG